MCCMCYVSCMRTTLDLDDALLAEAEARVHAPTRKALIEMALRALLRESAAARLIAAGGSMPDLAVPKRRRAR
jgi:Arc/MetJ family transcription regulator